MNNKVKIIGFLLISALSFYSCQNKNAKTEDGKHLVACTTGMIADMVENIAKNNMEVASIMGPGVDPHLYKASHGDLTLLRNASIVFYNGLHLEGKMQEIFEQLSKTNDVYAVSDAISKADLKLVDDKTYDPHIWFDVSLWKQTISFIKNKLIEADRPNFNQYEINALEYTQKLDELHEWVKNEIEGIPDNNRILITSHDAFGYFGKAYNIDVKGLQGISTSTEFGLNDVSSMVDMIVKNDIKAVFVESTISERSLNAVVEACKSKNHNLIIGGTLYSDAMGNKGTDAGNYIGMVRHNVSTIVSALK